MQPRRKTPLILLLLTIAPVGGAFGLSYIYTPNPMQAETKTDIRLDKLRETSISTQPQEYP